MTIVSSAGEMLAAVQTYEQPFAVFTVSSIHQQSFAAILNCEHSFEAVGSHSQLFAAVVSHSHLCVVNIATYEYFEHRHAALVSFVDQLVVDVGNVHDPVHFIAAVGEVSFDAIEDHGSDHVTDMRLVVNRGSAEVDADFPGLDGAEGLFLLMERVVNLKC